MKDNNFSNLMCGNLIFVVRHGIGGRRLSQHCIQRVTKTMIVLDDGSKWTHNGNPKSTSHSFWQPYLRRYTPELIKEYEKQRLLEKVAKTRDQFNTITNRQLVNTLDPKDLQSLLLSIEMVSQQCKKK